MKRGYRNQLHKEKKNEEKQRKLLFPKGGERERSCGNELKTERRGEERGIERRLVETYRER